jgi:hypothetical protein
MRLAKRLASECSPPLQPTSGGGLPPVASVHAGSPGGGERPSQLFALASGHRARPAAQSPRAVGARPAVPASFAEFCGVMPVGVSGAFRGVERRLCGALGWQGRGKFNYWRPFCCSVRGWYNGRWLWGLDGARPESVLSERECCSGESAAWTKLTGCGVQGLVCCREGRSPQGLGDARGHQNC